MATAPPNPSPSGGPAGTQGGPAHRQNPGLGAALHHGLKEVGQSFGALLQAEGIRRASDMPSSRELDGRGIAEVGRSVGLRDASRFARLLRRNVGQSATAHRRSSMD